MIVAHLQRAAAAGGFSVERLYDDLRAELERQGARIVLLKPNRHRGVLGRLAALAQVRRVRADVLHVVGDVHYLALALPRERTVVTVLDLVGLARERGLRRWLLRWIWYRLPLARAAHVIVISEAVRRELAREVDLPFERVSVIRPALSPEFLPQPRPFRTEHPRVLLVGTGPTKNLERSVAALTGIPCELAIIGALDAAQHAALAASGLAWTQYQTLSRVALVDQYRACDLLLFASTYEGYGLPIIEAQAVGRPVVTSAGIATEEAAGEAACLVDPLDRASIRAGVLRVIADARYRDDLVARGFRNAARHALADCARRHLGLYDALAETAGRVERSQA
jgi:glycosyltransferase involved in cell wall biosynthesis